MKVKSGMFTKIIATLCLYGVTSFTNACGLQDNGDGTMSDLVSGIQIQKCGAGQNWSTGQCRGEEQVFQWSVAVTRYGQGAWRLMTQQEANTIASRGQFCRISGQTWTSTAYTGNDGQYAYAMDVGNSSVGINQRENFVGVRLIRINK